VRPLLDVALDELALFVPEPRAGVERVDVDDQGAVHLTHVGREGTRWFTFDDRGLLERHPKDDDALPIARRLQGGETIFTYRPGRRVVVEQRTRGERRIAKGYRRKRSREALRRHQVAEGASRRGGFRIARLLVHHRDEEALVFEPIEGHPLWLDGEGVEGCFRLGKALAHFQTTYVGDALDVFGPEQELAVLERWREKAERALGGPPQGWLAARDRVREVAGELPEPRIGLVHRDFHDGQCIETPDGIALLDFDQLARGDVALDPANFLAHLSLRGMQGESGADESSAHACGEALLAGLDRQDEEGFWIRLRFYEATTFLRLALLYSLRPRWAEHAPTLLRLGERCLDDLVRIG